jgi:hypothetical protein
LRAFTANPEDATMSKHHLVAFACILTVLGFTPAANAADYTCPAPGQIDCVPVKKQIGAWKDNGSMATGNAFGPNNQCANVINLPNGQKRLVCCYNKCGVFLQDVTATECTKTSQSTFVCH